MKTRMEKVLAKALKDAVVYGSGFLRVDDDLNITHVNLKRLLKLLKERARTKNDSKYKK